MDDAHHLPTLTERQRYESHRNSPNDPAYRAYLNAAVEPLLAVLKPGACGLDFGCGPGPTISVMFAEAGFEVRNYDPFFAPDSAALEQQYDFVVCTETAEHFFNPKHEFELLHTLVKSGGWLSLMTRILEPNQSFENWWYAKDPTHVSFYSSTSVHWIAKNWCWEIMSTSNHVQLLRKSAANTDI
jgi:2-polyprenyl-3-methyl-5-hydroxy-6-metoxy-1,4-benzoquinol methylase